MNDKSEYEAVEVVAFHPVAGVCGTDSDHMKLYICFRIGGEVFYDTLDIGIGCGDPAKDSDYNKKK